MPAQFNTSIKSNKCFKARLLTVCCDSLGPHQVLVFEGRTLKVDDSLGPQGHMEDPPNLDVHLCRAKDHHIVVLRAHKHKQT